jgi:hypothetical protein
MGTVSHHLAMDHNQAMVNNLPMANSPMAMVINLLHHHHLKAMLRAIVMII